MTCKTALIALLLLTLVSPCVAQDASLQTAVKAAKWLDTSAIQTKDGIVWPSDPRNPKFVTTTLYAGTPGPILFFLELYRYTGEKQYLHSARAGADALLATITTEEGSGLYVGIAGIGFTLGEAYLITGEAKYREGALRCVELLRQHAKSVGSGVEWKDTTDIIAGGSGTGLFLLWADEHLHALDARQLAVKAGERLIELAHQEGLDSQTPRQLKWMMDSKFPREMPNFSHGTAGVAYFLATLYRKTHDQKFLDAAIAGANYLRSIADKEGDYCLIYHDSENRKLYYLSWCHGPAGTARLFFRLYQVTKDPKWLTWVKKATKAMTASGAPERVVTPGEWNNISVCCGVTGQAQFFLDMYQITRDRQYLDMARKATALLVAKSMQDHTGVRWVQAETRVKPNEMLAQTGYMQGASGVGMWLLHLSAFMKHSPKPVITLPDNPFTY